MATVAAAVAVTVEEQGEVVGFAEMEGAGGAVEVEDAEAPA